MSKRTPFDKGRDRLPHDDFCKTISEAVVKCDIDKGTWPKKPARRVFPACKRLKPDYTSICRINLWLEEWNDLSTFQSKPQITQERHVIFELITCFVREKCEPASSCPFGNIKSHISISQKAFRKGFIRRGESDTNTRTNLNHLPPKIDGLNDFHYQSFCGLSCFGIAFDVIENNNKFVSTDPRD